MNTQITKNMKKLLLIGAVFVGLTANSQTVTIEKTEYPYYDIFEWKGMGGILLSKDPAGNSKQINMTLVGSQPTSIWDQKFTPRNEDYYFISSENARYVYFLHNLNPELGKIYFAQLNSAGNVKATSVSLSSAIKKLGDYNVDELELRNVVVTDKALVHQFRYHNKKEKSYTEIATFITHHNMLVYAVELGTISEELLKLEKASHWRYIGFDGDKIAFASHESDNKAASWAVNIYSSKGELLEGKTVKSPGNKFMGITNIGFGTTGAYHLNNNEDANQALLTFHDNTFYASGVMNDNNQSVLHLFELKEGEWHELNKTVVETVIGKKGIQLGIYPLNEGLGYHIITGGSNITTVLKFDQSAAVVNPFTEKTVYNPSRILVAENKTLFAVTLPDGILFFNLDELKKDGSVEFEFKAK